MAKQTQTLFEDKVNSPQMDGSGSPQWKLGQQKLHEQSTDSDLEEEVEAAAKSGREKREDEVCIQDNVAAVSEVGRQAAEERVGSRVQTQGAEIGTAVVSAKEKAEKPTQKKREEGDVVVNHAKGETATARASSNHFNSTDTVTRCATTTLPTFAAPVTLALSTIFEIPELQMNVTACLCLASLRRLASTTSLLRALLPLSAKTTATNESVERQRFLEKMPEPTIGYFYIRSAETQQAERVISTCTYVNTVHT